MLCNIFLFAGFTKVLTARYINLSNAACVGAKTVNGSLLCKVSTKSATFTAATSDVWSFELTSFSTMFLEGYIGAPPAIAFFVFERINSFRTLIQ
jgi:hypothetical protein